MKTTKTILILLLFPILLFAQKIENTASFRDIKTDNYFRFNYDNDYFTGVDQNYTQGYNFELVAPIFEKNPINKLFFKPKNSEFNYGLSLEHIGFTPNNIKSTQIQYDDRPFAAAIMLKSFVIATDTIQKSRFVSSLNLGIIGPGAFGKEMQVAIHEATGNTIPGGWQNQIKNDVVLNYELNYEKQILRYSNIFSLNASSNVRIGTLYTNASIGLNTTIGLINNPFSSSKAKRKFELYFFSQVLASAIGYDATLQGGLFNTKSPYTINSIERFTAQNHYGIIMQTKRLYFEYFQTLQTREYEIGKSYKWGGIKIGFRL
ncbi:lipid A deacylase LpxR family protein [Flavobacterium sp.]|uniref:lipid A deacylase LpxR family protein n=1 Tax=Flavobacterium sp. TaxID=239 RepID=UPI0026101CE9|nr:lipid A deacylase LpxR family protein [Flavobacterium sp.]